MQIERLRILLLFIFIDAICLYMRSTFPLYMSKQGLKQIADMSPFKKVCQHIMP